MGDSVIQGTFHFHSTYSHDGKNTLSETVSSLNALGFSFCVMTEHFEDFDAPKLERYVREAHELTDRTGFLVIPGVEVDLSGLHTIVFPVTEYAEIARFAQGQDTDFPLFKILAHPSKYSFEKVARHVEKYHINGVELWNQQADGRYTPPLAFLALLKGQPWRNRCRYFFGCDLHNSRFAPSNVISIQAGIPLASEAVVSALTEGNFIARNVPTGIEYSNGSDRTDFDAWLQAVSRKSNYRGKILRGVRSCLKSIYRMLPRDVRHSLNDFKNFVRDKV